MDIKHFFSTCFFVFYRHFFVHAHTQKKHGPHQNNSTMQVPHPHVAQARVGQDQEARLLLGVPMLAARSVSTKNQPISSFVRCHFSVS